MWMISSLFRDANRDATLPEIVIFMIKVIIGLHVVQFSLKSYS